MCNKIFIIMSGNKFCIIIQRAVCCKYFIYIFNLMSHVHFSIYAENFKSSNFITPYFLIYRFY